jgi:pterin-4a-carbinolamine dehydratase
LTFTSLAILLVFVCPFKGLAQTDSLLTALHKVIEKQEDYTDARLARIEALHQRLLTKIGSEDRFEVLKGLTTEYETFIYDSAFSTISRLQKEAYKLNHPDKIAYAKVKLGLILLSAGMFKETLDSLESFTVNGISDSIKIDYYFALARGYYDLGDFNRDPYYTPLYVSRGNAYIDSARNLCKPGDFLATYLRALRNLKNENTIDAKNDLTQLLSSGKLTDHEVAVTASTLSHYYVVREDYNTAIDLLLRSAIADIRSATKETAAMSSLAEFLYKTGDVQNAYIFIQQAMDDAVFYGQTQ